MGYQPYSVPMAAAVEPPEAQTIRSLLHIARIFAIIVGILLILAGTIVAAVFAARGHPVLSVIGILLIVWGIVDFVIYTQLKAIEPMVNQRQYEAAKAKTLVWMIIGFLLGGIIIGILVLVSYLEFDRLITWQRSQLAGGGGVPPMAAPMPGPPASVTGVPPMAAGPPAGAAGPRYCTTCGSPNPPGARFCAKCGAAMPP